MGRSTTNQFFLRHPNRWNDLPICPNRLPGLEKIALDPDMIEVRDPWRWGCLVGQVEQALTYRSKANESNMLTISRNFACKIMHVLSAYCTDQYFLFCAYGMLMRRYRNQSYWLSLHQVSMRLNFTLNSPSLPAPEVLSTAEQETKNCLAMAVVPIVAKSAVAAMALPKSLVRATGKRTALLLCWRIPVVNRFYCRINAALWIWSEILNSS